MRKPIGPGILGRGQEFLMVGDAGNDDVLPTGTLLFVGADCTPQFVGDQRPATWALLNIIRGNSVPLTDRETWEGIERTTTPGDMRPGSIYFLALGEDDGSGREFPSVSMTVAISADGRRSVREYKRDITEEWVAWANGGGFVQWIDRGPNLSFGRADRSKEVERTSQTYDDLVAEENARTWANIKRDTSNLWGDVLAAPFRAAGSVFVDTLKNLGWLGWLTVILLLLGLGLFLYFKFGGVI